VDDADDVYRSRYRLCVVLYSIVGSCVIEYEQMILAIEAFTKAKRS